MRSSLISCFCFSMHSGGILMINWSFSHSNHSHTTHWGNLSKIRASSVQYKWTLELARRSVRKWARWAFVIFTLKHRLIVIFHFGQIIDTSIWLTVGFSYLNVLQRKLYLLLSNSDIKLRIFSIHSLVPCTIFLISFLPLFPLRPLRFLLSLLF